MMTLRWYHEAKLHLVPYLNAFGGGGDRIPRIDVDRISYFEFRGYMKELGHTPKCDFFINKDCLLVLMNCER